MSNPGNVFAVALLAALAWGSRAGRGDLLWFMSSDFPLTLPQTD